MNCGHVADPLIEAPRGVEVAPLRALAHEEPGDEEEDVYLGAETLIRYSL